MANNNPSPSTNHDSTTKITDMDIDTLVHCASYLNLQDISNMSISSKFLNRLAYSDSIWQRLFRERWPWVVTQTSDVRGAYLARYTALQQFKFADPAVSSSYYVGKFSELLFTKDSLVYSQGSPIEIWSIDNISTGFPVSLIGHTARITSMRLFPLKETSFYRNEAQINDDVLVTSSCDHSIRLWWKGSCKRCFKGHNGPVTVLSDKLMGDGSGKVFASGGEDSTVRLWSLNSSGKHGQRPLKATLYGHEKPIVFMSVSGHRTSLLVSMSTDSKVRVWDASVSSSNRNSSCVGMTSVTGVPVGMKCHDSLIYVAAGFSIEAVDLRTMRSAFQISTNQEKMHSFEILPSKFLACTGGLCSAMLWDIRKSSGTREIDPVSELDGHTGPVKHLHMDPYKIVTGGPEDTHVNIWETDTGNQTNSLPCSSDGSVCLAMAADGFRIVTSAYNQDSSVIRIRDFNKAVCSVPLNKEVSGSEQVLGSKFWGASGDDDDDDDDYDTC